MHSTTTSTEPTAQFSYPLAVSGHSWRTYKILLPAYDLPVSREGLAPIVKAYSRLIPVDGLVL